MKQNFYHVILLCWVMILNTACDPSILVGVYGGNPYDDLPKFKLAPIPKNQSVIYFQRKPESAIIQYFIAIKKENFDAIKITNLSQKYDYTVITLLPGKYIIQTIDDPLVKGIKYVFRYPKEKFLDQLTITVKPNQHYFIQQDSEKLTLLSETQGLYNLTEKYYIKPRFAANPTYQEENKDKIIYDSNVIMSISEYQDRMLEYQKYHDQIKEKYPMGFDQDKKAWAEKILKEHPTKALIWIYRPAYLWSFKRTPAIFYNEQELFDLKDGTYTVIMVESGIHQLKSDWLFLMRRATNLQLYFQGGSSYFFRWHVDTGLLQLDESLALTELPSTRYIPPKFGAIPHYESEFRNSRAE